MKQISDEERKGIANLILVADDLTGVETSEEDKISSAVLEGNKAQLEADKESVRELFEESEKVCMEHGMRKKRKCDKCWQALKERWLG